MVISEDDVEEIRTGCKHVVMRNEAGGVVFECTHCKGTYKQELPCEIWLMTAVGWGFSKQHCDCEESGDE